MRENAVVAGQVCIASALGDGRHEVTLLVVLAMKTLIKTLRQHAAQHMRNFDIVI